MKLRKNKKGFTIVELVIVIAVIGVLAAVLIPTFINLNNKANKAADESLVKNLNTALATQEQILGDKPNDTMNDAVEDLKSYGYLLPNLVTKSEDKLLWNKNTNRFLLEKDVVINSENKKVDYWRIQDNLNEQEYSVYAGVGFEATEITGLKVGFDAGEKAGISSISYIGGTSAQDVVIRTNGGMLTVNAPADTVKHYGDAKIVNIEAVASASYHEHGNVSMAKIANGRVVVTEEAKLSVIRAIATNDVFTNIKVAVVGNATIPTITRDTVALDTNGEAGSQLVLEVQTLASETSTDSQPQYVWISVETAGNDAETTISSSSSALVKVEESAQSKVALASAEIASVVKVSTADELDAALAAHKSFIMFANDITHSGEVDLTYSVVIDGDGHKLTTTGGAANVQNDDLTPGWKFYNGVLNIKAADIKVKITNIDLINNRSTSTGIAFVRTATNTHVTIENTYISAPQYGLYTHVGSSNQHLILNNVIFDPTKFNALYWRGANGSLEATNTSFGSTNTSSSPTNSFTTFQIERPNLVMGEIFHYSNNEFTFNNCKFTKVQLGSNLQTLLSIGSGNNTVRFNNTDFDSSGVIQIGGKMIVDEETIDLKQNKIYVNGVETLPINSGMVVLNKSVLTDGRTYWSGTNFYNGTFSFDVSSINKVYVGYETIDNGNGTWTVVKSAE